MHIPYIEGVGEVAVFCGSIIGACIGFLWFNAPPAKIFMGDTGSLSLGGSLGAVGIITKHEIVLAITGGIFVLEATSVIIQVTIKKNGGFRWAVAKEFYRKLEPCLEGHLDGSLNYGVVLPPIRKPDNKCKWAAIDVDGEVYNNDQIKIQLLQKVEDLKLPLIPCYSKSKGLHLYIFFNEWTAAKTVSTRRWRADRYFNKEFKQSHEAHLGGDEKYIPELRNYMRLQ